MADAVPATFNEVSTPSRVTEGRTRHAVKKCEVAAAMRFRATAKQYVKPPLGTHAPACGDLTSLFQFSHERERDRDD
jgi:hypothetical protein